MLQKKEELPVTPKAFFKARKASLKSLTPPTTASPRTANLLQLVTTTNKKEKNNKRITFFQFNHINKRKQLGRCITLNERKKKSDRRSRRLLSKLSNQLRQIGIRLKSNLSKLAEKAIIILILNKN